MKLHHTVHHTPIQKIASSIEVEGLVPQVSSTYKDLVPENIRHLPIVWLAEGIWQGWEYPVFEIDSEDLNSDKLYPNAIVYEKDRELHWWVYQGHIPRSIISRVQIPSHRGIRDR